MVDVSKENNGDSVSVVYLVFDSVECILSYSQFFYLSPLLCLILL
jgi:hypothetical protein